MPSFFELMRRMAKGEKAFQAKDNAKAPDRTPTEEPAAATTKAVPEVSIVREDCRLDGTRMTCYVHIQNHSPQSVHLDDITIFGQKHELQAQLDPGERREFLIYNTDAVKGNYVNDCYLLFRDENGDYFQSIHNVECEQQPDGVQLVKRIRFVPPVKDV